jgi:hypothetical protein
VAEHWATVPIRHGKAGFIEATVPAFMSNDVLSKLSGGLKFHCDFSHSISGEMNDRLSDLFAIPLAIGNKTFVMSTGQDFVARPTEYIYSTEKSLRFFFSICGRKVKKHWRDDINFAASHYDSNELRSKVPRLRNEQVYVDATGEHASYVPPPAECIPPLMDDLYRFISDDHHQSDGFATALYCMLQFLAIHPLVDGNGRFARAIFARLAKRGLGNKLYARVFLSVVFVKYIDRAYSAILNYCITGNLTEMRAVSECARHCTDQIFQEGHALQ